MKYRKRRTTAVAMACLLGILTLAPAADAWGYTPVSYTHLDVYKRQVFKLLLMMERPTRPITLTSPAS